MARITRRLHDRVIARIYVHVDLYHPFHSFFLPRVFFLFDFFCAKWNAINISQEWYRMITLPPHPISLAAKEEKEDGRRKKAWRKLKFHVENRHDCPPLKSREDDRNGISFASPPSAKVSSIFVRSGTLFAESLRAMCCLVAASLKCDTILTTYWDGLFGDESVKIASSGMKDRERAENGNENKERELFLENCNK